MTHSLSTQRTSSSSNNMRNRLLIIAAGSILTVALTILVQKQSADSNKVSAQQNPATSNEKKFKNRTAQKAHIVILPSLNQSSNLNSPSQNIEDDLASIESALTSYRKVYGSNPTGFNNEITAKLTGKNAKRVAAFDPNHTAISDNGALLDRWGTPFRFHALSGSHMTVTSAGPDRQFNTEDDSNSADL